MTSRSSRRRGCIPTPLPTGGPARPTTYELGALAEPELLYVVVVSLAAGENLRDEEVQQLHRELAWLVPLKTQRRSDRLCVWLLCSARAAAAAAWRTAEAVRAASSAELMLVEVGLPGEQAPELVLTRDAEPRSRRDQRHDR